MVKGVEDELVCQWTRKQDNMNLLRRIRLINLSIDRWRFREIDKIKVEDKSCNRKQRSVDRQKTMDWKRSI